MKLLPMAVICAATLSGLGGCGSSTATVAGATSFRDLSAAATDMNGKYIDSNGNLLTGLSPASTSDINSSANATYNGYVGGEVGGDALVGTLTVNANFSAGTATNTATGFVHETDGAYAGTLSGAGVIQPTAPAGTPQISTSLDGTLANGGVDYATSLALDGSFVAAGADPTGAIAGTADGTVGSNMLIGLFAAEK